MISNDSDISTLSACPDCDLLYHNITVEPGHKLRCSRCGSTLKVPVKDTLNKAFALSLTGLILFIPAMTLPIMTISVLGMVGSGSVFKSMVVMFTTGYPFVGLMVLLVGILFPLVKLTLLFLVSLSLKTGNRPQHTVLLFKIYNHLSEWGMAEVYMLGILVSIIKMHSMGDFEFNLGFFCFTSLFLITVASSSVVDEHVFWKLMESPVERESSSMEIDVHPTLTASEAGLIRCMDCGVLVPMVQHEDDEIARCPRCRAVMHSRKPGSINKTWAFIICSLVLFIPANVYPIMQVNYLGNSDRSTIMDGIIYFFQGGDYFIGIIIFVASILVPLFKIVGLVLILFSIHFGWKRWLVHKTKMFRFVEFIGRWSFLDIFVIALSAAIIKFSFLTTITANPAARYFTAVVITTMFAAIVFDPRILWDAFAKNSEINEE